MRCAICQPSFTVFNARPCPRYGRSRLAPSPYSLVIAEQSTTKMPPKVVMPSAVYDVVSPVPLPGSSDSGLDGAHA